MSVINFGTRLRNVGLGEVAARIEIAQRPRIVVVPVDERRLPVYRDGARLEVLRLDPRTRAVAMPTTAANEIRMRQRLSEPCSRTRRPS